MIRVPGSSPLDFRWITHDVSSLPECEAGSFFSASAAGDTCIHDCLLTQMLVSNYWRTA